MGTKAKDFGSCDRVPQAEGSQASGPWGAVPTSREKGRAGFGLPSSSSVRLRLWGRGPRPPHAGWGLPRTGSGPVLLPPGDGPHGAKAVLVCLGVDLHSPCVSGR